MGTYFKEKFNIQVPFLMIGDFMLFFILPQRCGRKFTPVKG